jgi:hypothetical protein
MSSAAPTTPYTSRWRACEPKARILADAGESEPTKPSKPGSVGFVGSPYARSANILTWPGNPGRSSLWLDLDCSTRTTRPMSCGATSGLVGLDGAPFTDERMSRTINSDGAGPARA